MRNIVVTTLAAAVFSLSVAESSVALPSFVPGSSTGTKAADVQDVRLYCYNRYTGRFLHWGPCGGYRRVYYRRPGRTYCYNRYTGAFLHWGACY